MSKTEHTEEQHDERREAITFGDGDSVQSDAAATQQSDVAATQQRDDGSDDSGGDATGDTTATEAPGDEQQERPTLAEVLRAGVTEEDKAPAATYNLGKILGGDLLSNATVRSQVWLLLLITLFLVIYISNRYSYQQRLIRIDAMNIELQDAKYRALSSTSTLTEKCRESRVLEHLKTTADSVLQIPIQPPYIIKIPKE